MRAASNIAAAALALAEPVRRVPATPAVLAHAPWLIVQRTTTTRSGSVAMGRREHFLIHV